MAVVEEVGRPQEDLCPLRRGQAGPRPFVESRAGSADRGVDVGDLGSRDAPDDLLGGRAHHRQATAAGWLRQLPADPERIVVDRHLQLLWLGSGGDEHWLDHGAVGGGGESGLDLRQREGPAHRLEG